MLPPDNFLVKHQGRDFTFPLVLPHLLKGIAMALVVEDGTGLPNSNSYITVEYADRYFADRGLDQMMLAEHAVDSSDDLRRRIWHGDVFQKQGAIIRATDHIEAVFGYRFLSKPLNTTQSLSFPRVEWQEVPLRVQRACAEYALHALNDELIPQSHTEYKETTSGKVIRKREKIGPIEEDITYSPEGAIITTEVHTPKTYPTADLLLSPFIILHAPLPPELAAKKIQWGRVTKN